MSVGRRERDSKKHVLDNDVQHCVILKFDYVCEERAAAQFHIPCSIHLRTGERVCVDLANMLVPGEGMLVGSFASGLLLVHSECEESE